MWAKKIRETTDSVEKMLKNDVALGALGKVDDVANLVYYLASQDAEFITGQSLVVDGGQVR